MYGLSEAVPVRSALGICHLVLACRLCLLPWSFGAGFGQSMGAVPPIALIFLGLSRSPGLRVKVPWCTSLWAAPFSEAVGALHTWPGLVLLGLPYFVLPPHVRSCAVSHVS